MSARRSPCPACSGTKGPRHYVCPPCWNTIPTAQQKRLNRKDARAGLRLLELHRQINHGVPLNEIQVSP